MPLLLLTPLPPLPLLADLPEHRVAYHIETIRRVRHHSSIAVSNHGHLIYENSYYIDIHAALEIRGTLTYIKQMTVPIGSRQYNMGSL